MQHVTAMHIVSEFMTKQPWRIDGGATLIAARTLMREHGVRHLPVFDDAELVGVVSERDLRFLEDIGADLRVRDVMTDNPYECAPTTELGHVVEKMSTNKYGSAIVTTSAGIEGIFTANDACRALVEILHEQATS